MAIAQLRQLSKFARARNGCGIILPNASEKSSSKKLLLHRSSSSSFSSSASLSLASNVPTSSPKFPIPNYEGKSQPIPKIILPPYAPLHKQQDDVATNRQYQQDIANALRPSHQSQTPLLLQNLHTNCDAMYFWRSLDYWRVAVGEDTPVEIEVGKSYSSGNRVAMMFGEYLSYLTLGMEQESKELEEYKVGKLYYEHHQKEQDQEGGQKKDQQEVAYLAQNELFPQVINDIPIPQLCENAGYKVGEGNLYHTMLWMGPRHTVSPLHFDPLDNLLMQVVGWKRVLLFPPDDHHQSADDTAEEEDDFAKGLEIMNRSASKRNEPSWHYSGVDGNQPNTSAVDIENPDDEKYPNFKALSPTPYECILGPGDGLYIPKKWWHHVRSLEMSVSANVWWR